MSAEKIEESQEDYESHYIDCIGVDGVRHMCLPWENKCKCGMGIQSKKDGRDDWDRYSCWECTY
jgi:hypothetical protein